MEDRYAIKFKQKTDEELILILKDYQLYHENFLYAAMHELVQRDPEYEYHQSFQYALRQLNKSVEEKKNLTVWEWMHTDYWVDLTALFLFLAAAIFILGFPYFNTDFNDRFLVGQVIVPALILWQINTIAYDRNRRSFHFQGRLFIAFIVPLIYGIRDHMHVKNFDIDQFFGLFFVTLILSGVLSLIIFHIPASFLRKRKFYLLKWIRWTVPVTLIGILGLFVNQYNWFNSNTDVKIDYDDYRPLEADDFMAYSNFYSDYDGVISSKIAYKITDDDELEYLKAVCYAGESWINPWDRDVFDLLQHERYHFKITEVVTRLARKELSKVENELWKSKLYDHVKLLDSMQTKFDYQTDHSLIQDRQVEWQIWIDSMLLTLDPYWSSDLLKEVPENDSIKYYRNLNYSFNNKFRGANQLRYGEHEYTAHYQMKYESGELAEINYLFHGRLMVDDVHGFAKAKINSLGNGITERVFYDEKDQPIMIDNGYHRRLAERNGNTLNITYFDTEGNQIKNGDGEYRVRVDFSNQGNTKISRYYDRDGKRMFNNDGQYQVLIHLSHDSYKGIDLEEIEEINYGPNGKLLALPNGQHKRIFVSDDQGNTLEYRSLDLNDRLVDSNGYSVAMYRYDELGYMISREYRDNQGRLVELPGEVYAKSTMSYDRYGNLNRLSRYNSNDVLVEFDEGMATKYWRFDDENNNVMFAGYDTGGYLYFDDDGYGKTEWVYDSLDRLITTIGYDAYDLYYGSYYDSPKKVFQYDSSDRIVEVNFFDGQMVPEVCPSGYATYTQYFSEDKTFKETKTFDLEGNLLATDGDVAIYKYFYDDQGNNIELRQFDVNGEPALDKDSIGIFRYEHDDQKRMTARSYFESDETPSYYNGRHRIEWDYDDSGNTKETRYLDENGDLVKEGTAIFQYRYNTADKVIEEKRISWDGEIPEDEFGMVRFERDKNDNTLSKTYLDHNNHPFPLAGIATIKYTRDFRGNLILESNYDEDMNPTNDSTGVAFTVYTRDVYDRVISKEYYNAEGKPALRFGKYFIETFDRNNSGKILYKSYYNDLNNRVEDQDSVALYAYDINKNSDTYGNYTYSLNEVLQDLGMSITYDPCD